MGANTDSLSEARRVHAACLQPSPDKLMSCTCTAHRAVLLALCESQLLQPRLQRRLAGAERAGEVHA